MSLGQLLALIAIIIAFVVGATDSTFVFSATDWLLAAIALVLTLGGVGPSVFTVRRSE